jgi:hypothetical protein
MLFFEPPAVLHHKTGAKQGEHYYDDDSGCGTHILQKPGLMIPGATNVRILPENIKHGKMVLV